MLNLALIKARLGQYGMVWLLAFILVLGVALLAWKLGGMDYIPVADLLLTAAFPALALILAVFAIFTLVSRESPLTKGVLIVFGLILTLPLLWAPVLGVIGGAWVAHVSIEYSRVYANFRITVGQLLYAITDQVFGSPLVEAAWTFMQGFAALVGFVSAVAHTISAVRRLSEVPVSSPGPGASL